MKNGIIILIGVLLLATIWRAPGIVLHPSGVVYAPDVRFSFENAFTWATTALFAYYLCTINVWVGLFYVLASFSAYYPINTTQSEMAHRLVTYGMIWYALCVKYIRGNYINWVLNTLCVIALVHIGLLFGQSVFNYDPIMTGLKPLHASVAYDPVPNVGLMSCVNGASVVLAITLPAFFRRKWCWFIPLFIPAFIFAHTFIGPVAAVITSVCFIQYRKTIKPKWIILIGVLCVMSIAGYWKFVDGPDTDWRFKTWKSALVGKHKLERKLFGYGLGHWKLIYTRKDVGEKTLGQYFVQAHNEVIQGQFEMGIAFSVILIGYLISVLKRHPKVIPMCALISILITSGTFFIFHVALIAMISIIWLSLLEGERCPVVA